MFWGVVLVAPDRLAIAKRWEEALAGEGMRNELTPIPRAMGLVERGLWDESRGTVEEGRMFAVNAVGVYRREGRWVQPEDRTLRVPTVDTRNRDGTRGRPARLPVYLDAMRAYLNRMDAAGGWRRHNAFDRAVVELRVDGWSVRQIAAELASYRRRVHETLKRHEGLAGVSGPGPGGGQLFDRRRPRVR